jgi:type VI secretion system protein VasJ
MPAKNSKGTERVLELRDDGQNWRWAAFGKHPTAKDYFQLGEETPFVGGLFGWVEKGYQLLTGKEGGASDFCSWRFWAREAGTSSLVCGVVRVSSDSLGRPYPLVIMGAGTLGKWQENWDLLPFAAERTWRQIEFLGANLFSDFNKLEQGIRTIQPPAAHWPEHAEKRKALNRVGSPLDPYASFLDFDELKKLAAANAEKSELFVCLDRGPCDDKIMHVSLWHLLARDSLKALPNAMFMGGTLDRAYLAVIKRPLKPTDFIQLWSVSAPGLWKNAVGTEYAMDLLALGKQPISPDKPAGADVRYDPAYDELQSEVDKLSSPAAGPVDWEKVGRFASDILMNKSKDLLVASYLAVALIHTRRNDGFSVGLKLYLELMERFWEELYPQKIRMRGRVRALEWWLEKTEAALRQVQGLIFTPEQLALIKENLDRLEKFLGEHLENAPTLSAVRDYFNAISTGATEKEETQAPARAPTETAEGKPASAALQQREPQNLDSARGITSPQEAGKALSDGLLKISSASFYLWQQDPASPQAYRLTRKTSWYAVDELPPASDGQTRIAPPPAQVKNLLFELRDNGDAEALLQAAETRQPQYIFWIDLNRLVAEALARLGSRFDRARQAVCQETAFLLERLPGLEVLSFSDGSPFATPDTRNWLKGIAFRASPTAHSPLPASEENSAPGPGKEEVIATKIAELRQMMHRGQLIEALEVVQGKLRDSPSLRENLLWRLSLCQMLVDVGKARLALPHLEQVLRDIAGHGLELYDPGLAMRGLKLAWLAFEGQSEQRFKDQAQDVLHQIGRLDMPEMVRLIKG